MKLHFLAAALFGGLLLAGAQTAVAHGQAETVTPNFARAIPNVPGKSLVALEVDYAPGAASPAHVHARSAFIYAYVISGSIESQVDDGPRRIFKAGDSWFENPGARHSLSRNASQTEPARLLAVFVLDSGDKDLTTPVQPQEKE